MELLLERKWKKETYTIGRLYVDGLFECNTLEDKDRGLNQSDPLLYIQKRKVSNETAIPKGTYWVAMNITSPKYSASAWYWQICRGKVPRLLNVPGFEGILIHTGNTALDTSGCILVGMNTKVGRLTDSKATFQKLYKKLKAAADKGEEIVLKIE